MVLKATAGLRLLAEHKAEALLSEVILACIAREGDIMVQKVGDVFNGFL